MRLGELPAYLNHDLTLLFLLSFRGRRYLISYNFTTMRKQQVTVKNQEIPNNQHASASSPAGHLFQDLVQRKMNPNGGRPVQVLYDQADPTQCIIEEAAPMGAEMNACCLNCLVYPFIVMDCIFAIAPAMIKESAVMAAISFLVVSVSTCIMFVKKEQVKRVANVRKLQGMGVKTVTVTGVGSTV